jgi:hypothetical protein
MLNLIFGIAFLVVSVAGIISGIIQHWPALIIAGACFVVIGIIGLATRRPASAEGRGDEVFFLFDFGSPLRSVPALILLIAAFAAFFIFPPTHRYW